MKKVFFWLCGLGLILGTVPSGAQDLGQGSLVISGTRLTVSPESQTIPFSTPTIIETQLQGFDPSLGSLPTDLTVRGDFTGPEIDGVMVLETRPNEPFRIPRLALQGEYQLDNIRLMEGDDLLAYAEPRSSAVLVTQVLVTRVTSRALTLDEIRSYGIVADEDSFRAFSFTFGFAVDGEVIDYNVPVLYSPLGSGAPEILSQPLLSGGSSGTTAPRFRPPQMAPFVLELENRGGGTDIASGGCDNPLGDCFEDGPVSIPGVILLPTDVTQLHQFFSVVLLAKNDAPEGDPLVIRDLAARVTVPPGLRLAETVPPTPLGVPIPVRVPGPDGALGTGDDLTFLIAQAEGQAEVLIEGLKQGTRIVEFDLEGTLEGLPGGRVERVQGKARGAVIVRDATLGVTITHPDTVRTDEEYDLLLTISNTSNAPVNLLRFKLPLAALSGVQVVGSNERTVDTLLPGESELVEFRLRSLRTGKVVASSIKAGSQIDPSFEFTVGVGELGIPLSPDAIILPRAVDTLPESVKRHALALVGLGFSLATAPPAAIPPELPQLSQGQVDGKVYQLAQAGRHVHLGEDPCDSLAVLAAEWAGVREADWEWDTLRRRTQKGGLLGDAIAQVFRDEIATSSPGAFLDRFAATTEMFGTVETAMAVGSGVTLEVASRTSGLTLSGGGLALDRVRDLPFGEFYDLAGSQMAFLARPEAQGYTARLRDSNGGLTQLHLVLPDDAPGGDGAPRQVSWTNVSLGASGVATADFQSTTADGDFVLLVDQDGDGTVDDTVPGTVTSVAPRPFTAVAAVQNAEVDPSGHVLEILLTKDIDLRSLLPRDPGRFTIPGKVSNGGLVPSEEDVGTLFETIAENPFAGLRNTRIVRVVFNNPISPYLTHQLTIRDIESTRGDALNGVTVPVTTTAGAPGALVEGTVYGPDGLPAPFAKVDLFESDLCYLCGGTCKRHQTAAVQADSSGRFAFEYVRQTECGDIFEMEAKDPVSGKHGASRGRVRFIGQTMQLDILMLGRGTLKGKVTYEDGSVPETLRVIAYSPVFAEGREAQVDADGNYIVGDVPVGTVTLGAADRLGAFVYQTVEIPTAGAVVARDLTIIRLSPDEATGDVRGTVYEDDGVTVVYDAYLSLYIDGALVGVERSALDGTFDFGTVPAGRAEIEAFDAATGRSGAQVFFDVDADRINEISLVLRNDRGTVEGHIYRRTDTEVLPLAGAVVWVSGTPFNTVTDATGYYQLDSVFAGNRTLLAADLERQIQTSTAVTINDGGTVTRDLYFIDQANALTGLAGEVLDFAGNPVPGATVHLSAGNDQWFHEAITDVSGQWTIPDLAPGSYEIHAYSGASGTKKKVQIRFEGEVPFVTLQFKKGTIRGTTVAVNENGLTVPVVSLVTYRVTEVRGGLVDLGWEAHTLETAADGTFEIPDVLLGRYQLTISNAFHGEKVIHGELVFAGDIADHTVVFQQNGEIRGVVLDHDGVTPVEGAHVLLRHPSFSDYDLYTDEEGRFTFSLVPPTAQRFHIDVETEDGTVFRQGRIGVRMTRFGQELDVEMVLPKQGTVNGWVEDASGNPVPGAVITLTEHNHPRRRIVQNADGEGYYSFTNIFAGRVSLAAQAPNLGGLGGKTKVELTTEGEEVFSFLQLEATGEIEGRVLSPVDGQPVGSAQITLYQWGGGIFDAQTADASGNFRFRLLPMGIYRVWVFDPTTGRHGVKDGISLEFNNQVETHDVTLEVRGEVEGHLYEPGGLNTVPGATIKLATDSLVNLVTYSSTDVDGYYEFLGIPEGSFTLTTREPGGRRKARGTSFIDMEGERVTVDLFLEESGRVVGTVLHPPGVSGTPAGPFPNANTLIFQDGQAVGATLDNPYAFDGIIAGRSFALDAREVGGGHRGRATGTVTSEGEEVTVDVQMVPIGKVQVTVLDSFGATVSGADLKLRSQGFYGNHQLFGTAAADGTALFQDVGESDVSVYATHPLSGLKGSATGRVELEEAVEQITVQLEDSGRVLGWVMGSDGTTPMVEALVALVSGGRTLRTYTDEFGSFEVPSVPLGNFSLIVQQADGPGNFALGNAVTSNGQIVDVGQIVLDDRDPRVIALDPLSNSRDIPLTQAVTVTFSEAVDPARYGSGWFSFKKLSGGGVGHTVSWAAGNTQAVITPNAALTSFTGYELIVNDAYDPAGRRLVDRVRTVFYTMDVIPPTVIDVLPRNAQNQVPTDSDLLVTFSEPVAFASLSGTAFQLTNLTTGQGWSTTFTHLFGERQVLLVPVGGLVTDAQYQLTVQTVADNSGNVMAAPVTTTFWTEDTLAPSIDTVTFANGTSYTSGETIPVAIAASDARGVASVTVSLGEWSFTDTAAPWDLDLLAPVITGAPATVTVTIEATDIFGNVGSTTRDLTVAPLVNASAPTAIAGCVREGEPVVPGVEAEFRLSASDDEALEGYSFLVDGVELERITPINLPSTEAVFLWTPPLTAVAGDSFLVRLEARDFAGNITAIEHTVSVPTGTILKGGRSLFDEYVGQDLYLAEGTFLLRDPLNVASLTVIRGASLEPTTDGDPGLAVGAGHLQCGTRVTTATVSATSWTLYEDAVVYLPEGADTLAVTVTGALEVAEGARLDVSGRGYGGGDSSHAAGHGPDWVVPSTTDAGGSHGGAGLRHEAGAAGEVYDSVYSPHLPGAGGAKDNLNGQPGGGVLLVSAAEVLLNGRLLAEGNDGCGGGSGAGGTVRLQTGVLRGSGSVEVSGGDANPYPCAWDSGVAGGGRVLLEVTTLENFDPATQVHAWGGHNGYSGAYGGAGTILYRLPTSTYGNLILDNGTSSDGSSRSGPSVRLPTLGSGGVSALEVAGADVWVSATDPFRARWLRAWMVLLDDAGDVLGPYVVSELDGAGRARLTAAAVEVVAANIVSYRGEYRFDQLETVHGVDLTTEDPLWSEDLVFGAGTVDLASGQVAADTVTLRSGAVLRPSGGDLRVEAGHLIVEAGAILSVAGRGYPGGSGSHGDGYGPAGITPSTSDAGGSHGGAGRRHESGAAGEVYDSLYVPHRWGAGGAKESRDGDAGGGLLEIVATELTLDGEIQAQGADGCGGGAGAGGSVRLAVGTLRGGGKIDASGGDAPPFTSCNLDAGTGGGGRVAVTVDILEDFDLEAQVWVRGGHHGQSGVYAGAGTLFYQLPTDTYGTLVLDNGTEEGGAEHGGPTVVLPALGSAATLAVTPEGTDAWVEAAVAFQSRWLGAWMVLADAAGNDLGAFRVAALDGVGRALLSGAAAVAGPATTYRGEYRFDEIVPKNGTDFSATDPVRTRSVTFGAGVTDVATGSLTADDVTLLSGAVVVSSTGALTLDVAGHLIIESGARIDLSGGGYGGGNSGHGDGYGPDWVPASTDDAGGSHGGLGRQHSSGAPGEVYDSVYRPQMAGAGGAKSNRDGERGGGVIRLLAQEITLDGDLLVRGDTSCGGGGGAGGSVWVEAAVLRGAGTIDASGGDARPYPCAFDAGVGGGGRIGLEVDTLEGFDPAVQTQVWGGDDGYSGSFGTAGTVLVRTAASTYGALRVDSGGRGAAAVPLPTLGTGPVVAWTVEGTDAWVTTDAHFRPRWWGATMELLDASGNGLGQFQVVAVEEEPTGRVRLAGAAAVVGAASYLGEYRFDAVTLVNGAALRATDPVHGGVMTLGGNAEILNLEADTLLVQAGSVVKPASGGELRIDVSGRLTLEATARVDVSGLGYGAGSSGHPAGYAPVEVVAPLSDFGGSHGGAGLGYNHGGPPGEIYDSVYRPTRAGGGGSWDTSGGTSGLAGGGVIHLTAGELVLDGQILALGSGASDVPGDYRPAGAGGTVTIDTGALSGTGTIEVIGGRSEADANYSSLAGAGSGGGGRVVIEGTVLAGFDVTAQVKSWGGRRKVGSQATAYAGAGTVLVKETTDTHGHLYIHQPSPSGTRSPLPSIYKGTVGVVEVAGSDLWIEPADPNAFFDLGVEGMWVRVAGVDYAVLEQTADRRRLLLAGAAGSVHGGEAYLGVYKFDSVTITGAAQVDIRDALEAGIVTVDPGAEFVLLDIDPPDLLLLTPAEGTVYASGQDVTVTAEATDATAVASVTFTFGGQSFVDDTAPYTWTVPAPVVTEDSSLPITADAVDPEGNLASATVHVTVQPLAPGDPPTVAFACPTGSPVLAAGTGLDTTVVASHDEGVEKVEFFLGTDPTVLGTDFTAPYTFHLDAPVSAQAGDVLQLKARARSFTGTEAEVLLPVTVVAGTVLSTDTFLAIGDATLDGQTVIVAAGTLTVEGPHTFQDLVVLDGATVTHPAPVSGETETLDVALTGDLFVACGGAVDATGKGYDAGLTLPQSDPSGATPWIRREDFDTNPFPAWEVWNRSNGASTWTWRTAYNDMKQSSNSETYMLWPQDQDRQDYRLSARLNSSEVDWMGLVFRYVDHDNFYRLGWIKRDSTLLVQKWDGGVISTVAQLSLGYSCCRWYWVEVIAQGPDFEIWIDGVPRLVGSDASHPVGSIGFWSHWNAAAHFDNVWWSEIGTTPSAGGSHGGYGAGFGGGALTPETALYGNLFDPDTAGASGGGWDGTAGGGVIRLSAAGTATVDGVVSADGAADLAGHKGAGGSVRLDAQTIQGAGLIRADGGSATATERAGGGGRVALYGQFLDADLITRVRAAGGDGATDAQRGSAGTVYLKRDGQPLGDLIFDNADRVSDQLSEPPTIVSGGGGVIDAVSTDSITDTAANFVHSLAGAEIYLNGNTSLNWPILSHPHRGDTLTLDVSSAPLTAVVGDTYEGLYRFDRLIVRGRAAAVSIDRLLSTAAPELEVGATWQPLAEATVSLTTPAEGASYTAGDSLTVNATTGGPFGIRGVRFELDGKALYDTTAPYSWATQIPPVATSGPMTVAAVLVDSAGREWRDERTIQANRPSGDFAAPTVTFGSCPSDGDWATVGQALTIAFTLTDDLKLARYTVRHGSTVLLTAEGLSGTQLSASVAWTVPATAAPGSVQEVEVEVEDYAGNITVTPFHVVVPAVLFSGNQTLTAAQLDGQSVALGTGTFSLGEAVVPTDLVLLSGAVLKPATALTALDITASGAVRVQCGGKIDVKGLGYAGGDAADPVGDTPAGVQGALADAGGSHGGAGTFWDAGSAGESYDSVYYPQLSGAGGSQDNDGSGDGYPGGGAIRITAGAVRIDGDILAGGNGGDQSGRAGGAGGSVWIETGLLEGSGTINTAGGSNRSCSSANNVGAGGAGRIAIHADVVNGFNVQPQYPSWQISAAGGTRWSCGWSLLDTGAPGTMLVKTGASTYGDLHLDRIEINGADRLGPATILPALGTGTVFNAESAAADLWITGDAPFKTRWHGVWMALQDGVGAELGTFEVAELDGAGRARLLGAGAVTTATSYRGEYRFDNVRLVNSAQLVATDPVWIAGELTIEGPAGGIDGPITAQNLTVPAGQKLNALSEKLTLIVPGTLTIGTGAQLSVEDLGYPGGTSAAPAGGVPVGITAPLSDAGGSHGGRGIGWTVPGPAGEVYDSVYLPQLSGGGGALDDDGGGNGRPGAGVLHIFAGNVILDGDIRAQGDYSDNADGPAGAGGSVLIEADTLQGAGLIIANGGWSRSCSSSRNVGSGGGGRVALYVDQFLGFDFRTQIYSNGHNLLYCNWSRPNIAQGGTLYLKTATSTYGDLVIDNENSYGSADPGPTAELPLLGSGLVTAVEVSGSDAWVSADTALKIRWLGAWMVLLDGSSNEIGGYRVLAVDAAGRVLLEGAAALAAGAASYEGEYRFDNIYLRAGGQLTVTDRLTAPTPVVE